MAVSRDRTRQNAKGGGLLQLRQISPNASNTFLDVGYLGGTDLDDKHETIDAKDETGIYVDLLDGGQVAQIKSVLMQSSIDEINLVKTASGLYFELYYKVNLNNGRIQEINAAICKITPGVTLAYKGQTQRTIAITITLLSPKAAFVRNPVSYNIAADAFGVLPPYVIIENAAGAGIGVPVDTAAAVATGVL